ncbi:MAG: hypothetical protein HY287_14355 [Planctomycetes bacterium]|nr:hypothetical protein [Planctomycetota bacterium]MBI3835505.1 hypothetical protein [Planctomycetota bacterium]
MSIGLGLIIGRTWGYQLLFAGTIVYSLDQLAMLLNKSTRNAYLAASGSTSEMGSYLDMKMLDQGVFLSSLVSILCWWGFAFYIYWRRDYFREPDTLRRTLPR